ncbi:hypothetical protein M758_3G246500 [Ceratodon purpureus]|nr:hypothetical protein M758_3G246500 [Ceratodon purpureus]
MMAVKYSGTCFCCHGQYLRIVGFQGLCLHSGQFLLIVFSRLEFSVGCLAMTVSLADVYSGALARTAYPPSGAFCLWLLVECVSIVKYVTILNLMYVTVTNFLFER